jgi:hypothetical protein
VAEPGPPTPAMVVAGAPAPPEPEPAPPAPPAPPPVEVTPGGDGEVMDFTVKRRRMLFRVDDDIFEAIPALPTALAFELAAMGDRLREAAAAASNGSDQARMAPLIEVFRKLLRPASLPRFVERLSSVEDPIDPAQLISIVQGLLGRYGLRPTPPSGTSSPPPPGQAAGMTWTAPLSSLASTPPGSPSPGS